MTLTRASIRSFQIFQCVAIQQPAEMDNLQSYDLIKVKNEEEDIHVQTSRGRKRKAAVVPHVAIDSILITPDENNPNNYCKLCKKTFSRKYAYRNHLQNIHKMKLTPLRPKPNFRVTPDQNNPNFYCKSCKRTFSNKTNYHYHLKDVHKMKLNPPGAAAIVRASANKSTSSNNHRVKRPLGRPSAGVNINKPVSNNHQMKRPLGRPRTKPSADSSKPISVSHQKKRVRAESNERANINALSFTNYPKSLRGKLNVTPANNINEPSSINNNLQKNSVNRKIIFINKPFGSSRGFVWHE